MLMIYTTTHHQFRCHVGSSTSCRLKDVNVARFGSSMLDSDGDLLLGPAIPAEPPDQPVDDDNDDVLLGRSPSAEADEEQAQRDRRLSKSLASASPFCAWVVGVDAGSESAARVFGVGEFDWNVRPSSADVAESHAGVCDAVLGPRTGDPWGYLQYTVTHSILLRAPMALPAAMDLLHDPFAAQAVTDRCGDADFVEDGGSLSDVLDKLDSKGLSLLVVPVRVAESLPVGPCSLLASSIALTMRFQDLPVAHGHPALRTLKNARRLLRGERPRGVAPELGPETQVENDARYQEVLLRLPATAQAKVSTRTGAKKAGSREDFDPLRSLNALGVVQYLKSSRFFKATLKASHRYDHSAARPDPVEPDHSRTNLDKQMSTLDLVDMLIQRRRFEADRIHDRIVSIHIYSDSSPVTKEELQGMIMDIFYTDGEPRRVVLPGCTLSYGCFNVVSKAIALVWAVWLVAGPSEEAVQFFFEKVASIVTDHGTELQLLTVPNLVKAFIRWNSGVPLAHCASLVDDSSRLMPNALRISGWCHAWGNLMKEILHVCPRWPTVLDQIRSMVSFWRNRTWRKWVARAVGATVPDPSIFDHAPPSMAKWRYETIAVTMSFLHGMRDVCEHRLRPEMFANAQDKAEIKKVFEICADSSFWKFISCAHVKVFQDCELSRHWGLTCPCAAHALARQELRDKGVWKPLKCFMNSRKLPLVHTFLDNKKAEIRSLGESLTDVNTENDTIMYELILCMLHKYLQGIDAHFKYLTILPWALSRGETKDGAEHIMKLVKAIPWERHDPLTKKFMTSVGGDVAKVAEGAQASEALVRAIKPFWQIPFDESMGEGYHRATHYELIRATGSSTRHVKQSTRFKESLARCNDFVDTYAARGSQVFRYEWRAVKRILQTSAKYRWLPVQEPMRKVLQRVYREDARADEDFSSIVNREPGVQVDYDAVSGKETLRNEYLVKTLVPNTHYSVQTDSTSVTEDGETRTEKVETHFKLIEMAHGNHRPKRSLAADPDSDIAHEAALALQVVFEDRWVPPGPVEMARPRAPFQASPSSDPVWVRPSTLGGLDNWYKCLFCWETCRSDQPGCIVLQNPSHVRNTIPIMDETCPTICVCWALKKAGWIPVTRKCSHTTLALGAYDSFDAVRLKSYYQVLFKLPSYLPLTSSIPSREPVLFYKLLLRQQRVEPGLGHPEYKRIMNELVKSGSLPLPLEWDDAAEQPEPILDAGDGTDDVIVPSGPIQPPQPKRRRVEQPPGPCTRPGSSSDGLPKAPPPLPPPPSEGPTPVAKAPPPVCPGPGVGLGDGEPGVDDDIIVPSSGVGDDDAPVAPVPRVPLRHVGWVAGLPGYRVRFDPEYTTPKGVQFKANWQIKCVYPGCPRGCHKTRSVTDAFTAAAGDIEPLAYLHKWTETPADENKTHGRTDPRQEEVVAMAEARRDAFQAVYNRIMGL